MRVSINQPRQDGRLREVDHLRPAWDRDFQNRTHGLDPIPLDHNHAVGQGRVASAVEQLPGLDVDEFRSRICLGIPKRSQREGQEDAQGVVSRGKNEAKGVEV